MGRGSAAAEGICPNPSEPRCRSVSLPPRCPSGDAARPAGYGDAAAFVGSPSSVPKRFGISTAEVHRYRILQCTASAWGWIRIDRPFGRSIMCRTCDAKIKTTAGGGSAECAFRTAAIHPRSRDGQPRVGPTIEAKFSLLSGKWFVTVPEAVAACGERSRAERFGPSGLNGLHGPSGPERA